MNTLEKLVDAWQDLSNSASSEGCEPDLAVVDSAALFNVMLAVMELKKERERQSPILNASAEFVDQVARLSIWDYDKDDGSRYEEIDDEPDEGYLDSHNCLMGLIEAARRLGETQVKPPAKQATTTYQYLDLSTGHLSEETMDWINEASPNRSHCSGLSIAPYEYGAFVSVPGEGDSIDDLECSEDLKEVLRFAMGQGCDVVRLDADAGYLSELPMFSR